MFVIKHPRVTAKALLTKYDLIKLATVYVTTINKSIPTVGSYPVIRGKTQCVRAIDTTKPIVVLVAVSTADML
tara:strand:+ start:4780 stop:4998 length:219 start_codon:yes stop_codon:yes gene_type:complete